MTLGDSIAIAVPSLAVAIMFCALMWGLTR